MYTLDLQWKEQLHITYAMWINPSFGEEIILYRQASNIFWQVGYIDIFITHLARPILQTADGLIIEIFWKMFFLFWF